MYWIRDVQIQPNCFVDNFFLNDGDALAHVFNQSYISVTQVPIVLWDDLLWNWKLK